MAIRHPSSGRLVFTAAVGVAMCSAFASQASASLVLHWKLDESAGITAADSAPAGGSQNGTSGASFPQWQPTGGIIGGSVKMTPTSAADLDEVIAHTATAAAPIVTYPFTMAGWVKSTHDSTFDEGMIFLGDHTHPDHYASIAKYSNAVPISANRVRELFRDATNDGHSSAIYGALTDGAWHHFAISRPDANTHLTFVDGRWQGRGGSGRPSTHPNTRFALGAMMASTPSGPFDGSFDDVAVWDEAVSPMRMGLIHGLGRYSHVPLDDPSIPAVEALFAAQTGSVTVGDYVWTYAESLPRRGFGAAGLLENGNPYIILDGFTVDDFNSPISRGVVGTPVPEPTGALALVAAAAGGAAVRARRRRR